MNEVEMSPASPVPIVLEPVRSRPAADRERIVPLDALRGFALLGILVMNIQAFAMPDAAYMNPTAYGDLSGANFVVWLLSHVLFDQKFMTIFSMLFGAGILLMTERAESRLGRSAALHYRRMGVLLVFGLLHAYLLWYGDILYSYALCGMVAYLFRRFREWLLIVLGLAAIAIPSAASLLFGWSIQFWSPEESQEFMKEMWRPTAEMIADQIAAHTSGYWTEIVHRAPTVVMFQSFVFLLFVAGRAGGLMLVGMGLFKLGFFNATRSAITYVQMIAVALFVGIPAIVYGAYRNFGAGWDVAYSFFYGMQFNYWASMVVSLGWIGTVMLVCKTGTANWLTGRLAAVGQMALTNYLMHTLICTTLFYGRGFGLYGHVERVGQIAIVFAIWIFQLAISPVWLRHFHFGPAEWLWRRLTYLDRQPFRRTASDTNANRPV
jgi:uncharacterized protein